jgi:hypothetical protein
MGRPGLRKCLASRSASLATSGMAKAMVLPDPVRPRPRTSRPDSVSGRVLTWMGNGSTIPCAVRVSARALGVPRAAKVVMYIYGLSGGIQADIGPRCRLDQGFAEEKSGDQPGRCTSGQAGRDQMERVHRRRMCLSHENTHFPVPGLQKIQEKSGHHCTSSSFSLASSRGSPSPPLGWPLPRAPGRGRLEA